MHRVAFILGAGPGVGSHVAKKLKGEGYTVAWGSRHPNDEVVQKEGYIPISVDTSDPESIVKAFIGLENKIGLPNVVIYNVSTFTPIPVQGDPFSVPAAQFNTAIQIGGLGVYGAIREATKGFKTISASIPQVFIVTGSALPFIGPLGPYASLQLQKRSAAWFIELATKSYQDRPCRFYYASQVTKDGGFPFKEFSGVPHAIVYWNLIQEESQGEWDVRFIEDGSLFRH